MLRGLAGSPSFITSGNQIDVHDTVVADHEAFEESSQRAMDVFSFSDGQYGAVAIFRKFVNPSTV